MVPPEAGGERTEPATPKRRREMRRRGQVARTAELGPALALLGVYLVFSRSGPRFTQSAVAMMRHGLSVMADPQPLTANVVRELLASQLVVGAQVLLPPMAVAVCTALVGELAQVGFLLTGVPLQPRWSRISPLEGVKRLFSKQALVGLVRSLFKVGVLGYLCWGVVRQVLVAAPELMETTPAQAGGLAGQLVGKMAVLVGTAFLVVAIVDYIYQRWEHDVSMRMTRKELQEELKESEGDPQVRSRIRQRQRQLAMNRMLQAVPQADVVVTNPVHLAVALRYDKESMVAPVIVAKGGGLLAERIKEIARKHRVPVMQNVSLARGLYYGADVGSTIPPELYQAVAEVLAFVYRLRAERRSR
jgi:flagellar biosynthetic protein FlhB